MKCPKCLGHGVNLKHRTKCSLCGGTGRAQKLPSGEYMIANGLPEAPVDRDTMIPCPACEGCFVCGGTGRVSKRQ